MKKEQGCDYCLCREENAIKEYCNNPDSVFYLKTLRPNQKACKDAELKEKEEPSVMDRMRHNVKAYNKKITRRFLRKQKPIQLLHLVHEMDRREFALELHKEKLVTLEEVQQYLKK